ncbi:MAG: aldehyde dehydrogenase family protein [Gammaproteobacteria bacterium]
MPSRSAQTVAARNPRTAEVDYRFEQPGRATLETATTQLRQAQHTWFSEGQDYRCRTLLAFAEQLQQNQDALFKQLSIDTGRSRETALEITVTVDAIKRWCGQITSLLSEQEQQTSIPYITVRQQLVPYALVGCISPWNFPLLLSMIDAIPALLAGAAVAVKPSEITPRFVAPLQDLIEQVAGLREVLHFFPGNGEVGADLVEQVDLICFTGSVASGRKVAAAAAAQFIPAHLELGGKDPAIVTDNTNPKRSAAALCWGGMTNSGQSCLSIERIYLQSGIAPDFLQALTGQATALRMNYPDIDNGEIGPIISEQQINIIQTHLDDAVAKGATILCGGEIEVHDGGSWCQPTILTEVNHNMRVMTEETFGPLLPVMTFKDEAEAIRLANDTPYGLSAAVFSNDVEQAQRIARQLDAGAISINDAALTAIMHEGEKQAFKASGLGGSRMGSVSIKRFLKTKALIENTSMTRNPWWFTSTT